MKIEALDKNRVFGPEVLLLAEREADDPSWLKALRARRREITLDRKRKSLAVSDDSGPVAVKGRSKKKALVAEKKLEDMMAMLAAKFGVGQVKA